MSHPDRSKAYRTAILLKAARQRQHDDHTLAARAVRELLDVARPLATRSMEIEYAQALAYLALNTLYERLCGDDASADMWWADAERAVEAWKALLPRGPEGPPVLLTTPPAGHAAARTPTPAYRPA